MKYFAIFIILFGLIFLSCSKSISTVPENILNKKKMSLLLKDVFIVQSRLQHRAYLPVEKSNYFSKKDFSAIFKKHNISIEKFKNSLKYYSKDLKRFLEVYEQLIHTLVLETQNVDIKISKK